METKNITMKECLIISKKGDTLKNRYIKHPDSRYKLENLNKKLLSGNEIQFVIPEANSEFKIDHDYCLLLEDELDNSAQLITAVSDSKILESVVLCNDLESFIFFINKYNKAPIFIGLDFRFTDNEKWQDDTASIYGKIKTKWQDVPVIGITHHETNIDDDTVKIVSLLRKNADSVYNKASIWDALPNIFKDKYLISKLRTENEKVKSELKKVKSDLDLLRSRALDEDILKRVESKEFESLERKIIGSSKKIKEIRFHIELAAKSNDNVLILGETGSGKELVARAIHHLSKRTGKFLGINCAAIPDEIIEAELFGVIKGYPGFHNKEELKGKFDIAENGTIFLDELHRMSLKAQAKILRAIDEKVFTQLGGTEEVEIKNTRIIAAIKPNVEELIADNLLIEDLFGRLNSFMPPVPPLRDRKEDIPELTEFFLQNIKSNIIISTKAMEILQEQEWKRNIRELKNFISNLHTLYSFMHIINIEEDQINYALSLHKKTGCDDRLVQKVLKDELNDINVAEKKFNEPLAKELLKAIIEALEQYPSKSSVKLKEIAEKITMPGKGKTNVTEQHLSTEFNRYKNHFKVIMSSPEFSGKLSIAMKYSQLKKILTT